MRAFSITMFALSIGLGMTACKDEVNKAAECKDAATAYTNAHSVLIKDPSEATCEARNTAIINYRTKCEQLPDGADTVNCSIKENIDGLLK